MDEKDLYITIAIYDHYRFIGKKLHWDKMLSQYDTTHGNQAFSFNLFSVMVVVEPLNVKNLFCLLHQNMPVGLKSDGLQMLF